MRVIDLIRELKTFDKEALVVLAKDSEGNSFSPLGVVLAGCYEPSSSWAGELTQPESEQDPVNAVALWPSN